MTSSRCFRELLQARARYLVEIKIDNRHTRLFRIMYKSYNKYKTAVRDNGLGSADRYQCPVVVVVVHVLSNQYVQRCMPRSDVTIVLNYH